MLHQGSEFVHPRRREGEARPQTGMKDSECSSRAEVGDVAAPLVREDYDAAVPAV